MKEGLLLPSLFQSVAQIVGLLGKFGVFRHRRGAAAIPQHHSHVREIQIPHQRLIMGLQRVKRPAVAVPGNGQQGGLHVISLDRAVEGAEPVHHSLQLGGHPVVVERRGKHQHICVQNLPPDVLHIVLLHT